MLEELIVPEEELGEDITPQEDPTTEGDTDDGQIVPINPGGGPKK